jgi:hypothetical protein
MGARRIRWGGNRFVDILKSHNAKELPLINDRKSPEILLFHDLSSIENQRVAAHCHRVLGHHIPDPHDHPPSIFYPAPRCWQIGTLVGSSTMIIDFNQKVQERKEILRTLDLGSRNIDPHFCDSPRGELLFGPFLR